MLGEFVQVKDACIAALEAQKLVADGSSPDTVDLTPFEAGTDQIATNAFAPERGLSVLELISRYEAHDFTAAHMRLQECHNQGRADYYSQASARFDKDIALLEKLAAVLDSYTNFHGQQG